jgi:hypothetical protein
MVRLYIKETRPAAHERSEKREEVATVKITSELNCARLRWLRENNRRAAAAAAVKPPREINFSDKAPE